MKVLEVAQELMRFRTETGNEAEIKNAMDYIKNMMTLVGAKVDVFEKGTGASFFERIGKFVGADSTNDSADAFG